MITHRSYGVMQKTALSQMNVQLLTVVRSPQGDILCYVVIPGSLCLYPHTALHQNHKGIRAMLSGQYKLSTRSGLWTEILLVDSFLQEICGPLQGSSFDSICLMFLNYCLSLCICCLSVPGWIDSLFNCFSTLVVRVIVSNKGILTPVICVLQPLPSGPVQ